MANSKNTALAVAAFILVKGAFVCMAQPAARIGIEVDGERGLLSVTVKNPVSTPHDEYIRKIEVSIDGGEPIVRYFYYQKGDSQSCTLAVEGLAEVRRVSVRAYDAQGSRVQQEFDMEQLKQSKEAVRE